MPRTAAANQHIREKQRAKILEGARKVFAYKGRAATMADVAAAAGVSQGLAYRYFADKETLFRVLVEQLMQPSLSTMEHLLERSGTPGERLDFLVSLLAEGRREHPEFFQLLDQVLTDEAIPNDLRERIGKQNQVFREVLRQLIVEGQETSQVAQGDPDQLVTLVLTWLDGLSRLAWQDPIRFENHFPDARLFLRIFKPCSDKEKPRIT
jgi:AcrR family transcriptional regulator